jgi:hypothetical protein
MLRLTAARSIAQTVYWFQSPAGDGAAFRAEFTDTGSRFRMEGIASERHIRATTFARPVMSVDAKNGLAAAVLYRHSGRLQFQGDTSSIIAADTRAFDTDDAQGKERRQPLILG